MIKRNGIVIVMWKYRHNGNAMVDVRGFGDNMKKAFRVSIKGVIFHFAPLFLFKLGAGGGAILEIHPLQVDPLVCEQRSELRFYSSILLS